MNKRELLKTVALYAGAVALAIPAGRIAASTYARLRSHGRTGNFEEYLVAGGPELTLFGTSTCPHCHAARQFLMQSGVLFSDLMLDKDRQAEAKFARLGETAVPVLVSRHRLIEGFHEEEYRELFTSIRT